jgi:hypothetical protein
MVRFVHFIVDIIVFLVVYADNWNFVSVCFQLKEWIHTAFFFDFVFICIVFSVMEFKFQNIKFITKDKGGNLKGENLVLM